MKVSIIIPTYNEERDIAETLDAVTALDYPDKEIIVVDDSTDATPQIVQRYGENGVRLIRPMKRGGRCEARNLGIIESKGEVVMVLNADVRPDPDFLRRIERHYLDGYDYVLVNSIVSNTETLFPRYVEAVALANYDDTNVEWSEGFTCRRELAIKAGLFPAGFEVPICAGEDGHFGESLRRLGARKKIDHSIAVKHVAPASFSEYWSIRKGRGKGSPQVRVILRKWPLWKAGAWASLRVIKTLLVIGTILPAAAIVWRITRHSPTPWRDFFPFCGAWLIEQIAFHVGEWEGISEIAEVRRSRACCR
jgi:glycosyltransferase involved in cell wall biosynthesis